MDDEAPVRQVTRRMLETFGYRVALAGDGAEAMALDAEQKDQIAAVITDMMMPVMDGPATICALRRMRPDLRIIAASGVHARGNDAPASSIASVRHFLSKPYSAGELLAALQAALAD